MISETLTAPPSRRDHSFALFDGYPPLVSRPDVFGIRPDDPVVRILFPDVSGPTGGARRREHGREQVRGQPEVVQHAGRIEVEVGPGAFLPGDHLPDGP